MKVNYFFREYHQHQVSIEKLFNTIIDFVSTSGFSTTKVINPYSLSIKGIVKALFFFKNNQGDINHITGDIHWAGLLLDKSKTILTVHDLVGMNQYSGLKKWLYFILWVYLPIKRLKYVTAVSEKTKNEILKFIPSAKLKIKVIPNFILLPIKSHNNENIYFDKLNVLIVGTRENKNIERTLEALIDIDVNINIIGKLSDNQKMVIKKNHLKIINKIEISEEELILEYSKANILCFASLYEGFGLPILEAQAQNCCVITSNISPMKEVANDGALLVNPQDVSDIKKAILELINNKEKRLDLIIRGKNNILQYSKDIVCNRYLEFYKEIISIN